MQIVEDKLVKIFRKDYEERSYYRLGISKKDQNGNYVNGYVDVRFPKNTSLENGTNIYIKNAWLSFYLKDKKTIPYVFINEYETVEEASRGVKNTEKGTKPTENGIDPYEEMGRQVRMEDMPIDENELPF